MKNSKTLHAHLCMFSAAAIALIIAGVYTVNKAKAEKDK